MKYNATTFIQKFVVEDLEDIVKHHPYHAFFLLSSAIELLGKCLNSSPDWQNTSNVDFNNALNLPGLSKYKSIQNEMYSSLRCGLLHACMPKEDLRLVQGKNDIPNKVIGCTELYDDVKIAWSELKKNKTIKKDMTKEIFEVDMSINSSGMTQTVKNVTH